MILPSTLGPLAVELSGGRRSWAGWFRLTGGMVEWGEADHPHAARLVAPLRVDGDRLVLSTDAHGTLVVRAFTPADTWSVTDGVVGPMSAWEASQAGLV